MQWSKWAAMASVAVLGACGGGESKPQSTTAQPPAAAPAAPATTGAPITGKTVVVQMIGDTEKGQYRFDPAEVTLKQGDGIRFDGVSGGPHNVAFDAAQLAPDAKAALTANMPSQDLGELSGKLVNNGESYTISFANVPAGTYTAHCTPHLAMNMKLKITVTK